MIVESVKRLSSTRYIKIISQTGITGSRVISMLFILSLSSAYADDKTDERVKKDEFVGLNKTLKTYVEEASQRFHIPSSWIWAVMKIESAGDISALSKKGAMGLMQIMPETWQMLRQQYNLGSDPFSPRDNILAGAGYLRYLHERYGNPGVFAAYNAGPGRYEDYLKSRKLLPLETIDYTSKVNQWASLEMAQGGLGTIVEHNMAAHSDLFMRSPIAQSIHPKGDEEEMKRDQGMNQKVADLSALAPSSQGLFVKISERLESVE